MQKEEPLDEIYFKFRVTCNKIEINKPYPRQKHDLLNSILRALQ